MMNNPSVLKALFLGATLALAAGTPQVGAPGACASLADDLAAANATHGVVCSAQDDWANGAITQRSNVDNVKEELAAAKAKVPGLKAEVAAAQAAWQKQKKLCAIDQATFEAASAALAAEYKKCGNHTGTDPCRSQIATLQADMVKASIVVANCRTELGLRKDACDRAQRALTRACALVLSLGLELDTARQAEESTLATLQTKVDDAFKAQQDASAKYLTAVKACNTASDGLRQLLADEQERFEQFRAAQLDN